ncbi:hypothetical protein MRB53_001690 [Persea americana]|uniref:Uncharacterized protein n=1 Tax=Persea americana TaxID=3435 RepID=A0ACC2MSD6_PERAE|nr:hypothetical protein MRB53_001690 [Persea americana]
METGFASQEDLAFEFILRSVYFSLLHLPCFIFISQLLIAIGRTMDSATSMVAGAALSAFFQHLLDTLAPPFRKSLGLLFGVEKEAKKLKLTHSRIEALLTDAEEGQIRGELVRLWLSDLKHIAYDAGDIFDELEYRALGSKIEEAPIQTRKRKLTDQFRVTHLFSRFSSNFELGSRIKKIRESLDEIERESNHLRLRVIHHGPETEMLRMRRPTSSIVDESIVFGREADKAKLVRLLTSDDSLASDSGMQVVPICGMGGLGKTTLAQLIHNDERVKNHFDVSVWVYVSEDFDLIRLTKSIAESVLPRSAPLLTSLDRTQVSVQKALEGKKIFLVLDDVWNVNCNRWDALRAPLMVAGRGSRILVTTRSQRVSSMMGTVPTHSLRCLSDDDCWSIFKRLAFVEGDSDVHPDLVKIGKEIVNKCKGLPLAVTTLGGLLRSKVNVVDWKSILESEIWDLPEEGNDILPALKLSYHHLPAHLKQCFEFCSVFPKDSYINNFGDKLVLSWMAIGFIQSEGSKDMEDIGEGYLADLVSRSLLHEEEFGVRMHDLIHDLARSVSGAEILEVGDWTKSHKNAEKVRHLSCELSRYGGESFNFEYLYCFKSLRTLILQGYGSESVLTILPDLFVNLRHIRILDLSGNHITELPESIGNLIQLRCLDLSNTMIERLPKSISRLYNLQTLQLNSCSKLVGVPSDFNNLVSLRRLELDSCYASIPLGGLKSLRELEKSFKVGREIGYRVNELRDMIHLQGSLGISELENVVSVEEAKEAELKNKQKISHLTLEWESHEVDSRQEGIEEEVLNALQPHTNLKELNIRGYCGVRFPTWLGDSNFSKLVSISLATCKCPVLPPFGQLPSLEYLFLRELYGLKKVGREVYGDGMVKGFPSLKTLRIWSMPDLEEWTALEGDLIHVSQIYFRNCSKLRVLPDLFPLTPVRVTIQQCEKLATLPRVSTIRRLSLSRCDEQILRSLQHLTSLSSLYFSGFPTLTSLPHGVLEPLTLLEHLFISDCDRLISLSEEVGLQHLTSLQSLKIERCRQLTSLGDEVLPATLHQLEFRNVNRLPTGLQNVTSLVKLVLVYCPKIHSLPAEELPTTLQHLCISDCSNLDCLPTGLKNLTSLVELELKSCPKIHSLPEELPTTLQHLKISYCSNLDCLPTGLKNLTSLATLFLKSSPKIHFLPEELPTTLQLLNISDCSNLNCLPTGLKNLTSLASLQLFHCPKIHFLPEELPTSTLDRLVIHRCPSIRSRAVSGSPLLCNRYHQLSFFSVGGTLPNSFSLEMWCRC